MADAPRKVLVCSCEDTMPLDGDAVRMGCRGADIATGRNFCRSELDRVRAAVAQGGDLTIACTQEAPLFAEVAGDAAIKFVNIRETAGWSADAGAAGPKMAALIAAAAEPTPEHRIVELNSEGVILIYGAAAQAIEAANMLRDHLNVTVLLRGGGDVVPSGVTNYPVTTGTIRSAKGYLGAFELTVDNFATAKPSSRGAIVFEAPQKEATSTCDIILDVSGAAPLFPAADLRDGYLRADPRDPAAVLRAVLKARDLIGSFDKPQYIEFHAELCAHSRSKKVGCHRCLDLCPTGAIAPDGDHVAIDAAICAGCGQCAAACPTGAAAYALPAADALMRKLRTLFAAYAKAGGSQPVLLLHDEEHGDAMIEALARYGDGLPANVLPVKVNEVTQVGLETIAAAFAYGATAVRFLLRAKQRHDVAGLNKTLALAKPILSGLGFDGQRVATIETDDPDTFGEALREIAAMTGAERPANFAAVGGKREIMRLALRELHAISPTRVEVIALPEGAPFGTLDINVEGCTLCLSCVSACPTGALSDDRDTPLLRFTEDACVQCGLCQATCPEKVISLRPQINFQAATSASRVVKQEEPALCIVCSKPFGVKSTVDRITAKLEGKHWMFRDSKPRLDVIKMCADCRVNAMFAEGFDPLAGPPRQKVRTTEDYLRERDSSGEN
jgi:Fe-S-cluster-containing hydrogenase component 2